MAPRLLLLLIAAACGGRAKVAPNGAATLTPSAPASRPHDAVIEGRVTDAGTGSGVAGATIIAAHGDTNDVGITGETGDFHLAVPAGRYRVTVYFNDATVDGGEVDVAANGSVPLALALSHAVVVAPGRNPKDCPADASAPVATADERDALVAAVLEHYLTDPAGVMDGESLGKTAPVYVASDGGPDTAVTARSIPGTGRFVLRSVRDLQAEADRRGTEVGYVDVFGADIVGDCATLVVAASFKLPRGAENHHASCATSFMYEKKSGRWTFKKKIYDMCS